MLIEVCVDSMESVHAAVRGGADRLELCANLIIGGTTPSPFLIQEAVKTGVPVNVLIRPRFGDFLFTQDEKKEQLSQIEQLKSMALMVQLLVRFGRMGHWMRRSCASVERHHRGCI